MRRWYRIGARKGEGALSLDDVGTERNRASKKSISMSSESFCLRLSQWVGASQGRGDDTALNNIGLECCPLFSEALPDRLAGQDGAFE